MKILSLMIFALVAFSSQVSANEMRMAVTTSFQNSGLSDILLPEIKSDLGLDVQLLVVGTGQAIRLGEAGDVDAILVHSRAAEDAFVEAGFGTHRTEIMYNDFVLIGPAGDPAKISEATDAGEAFRRILAAGSPFVSRGDDSGTNKKELSLWEQAGISKADRKPDWFKETGSGMGATLNTASGMGAYVLSDRASWLKFGNKGNLKLLFSGDSELFNQYAYLPVNPQMHPHVKSDLAASLESWLISDRAKALIDGYEVNGQKLFKFNAKGN
ncbi:MAG: substrate-binding domain-containing protein [Rhizobiaceae bacterium]